MPEEKNEFIDPKGKTFIGYRFDCSFYQAYTVYYYLDNNNRDVYLNFENPEPGDFYEALRAAMHACEHYALVLSPDTFKGKKNKKEIDNLLWEIDLAKKIERNIVPVLFDGFSFEEHLKNIPSELRNFLKRQFGLPISYHNVSGDLHKLSTRFLIPQREEVSTKPIPDKAKEDLMRLSAYPVTRSVVKPVNWPIVRQNISDSDGFVSTSEFLGLDEKQREKYLDGPIYVQFNDLLTAPPGGGDLTWDVSIDDSDGHSQSILKDQFDIGTRDGNDF